MDKGKLEIDNNSLIGIYNRYIKKVEIYRDNKDAVLPGLKAQKESLEEERVIKDEESEKLEKEFRDNRLKVYDTAYSYEEQLGLLGNPLFYDEENNMKDSREILPALKDEVYSLQVQYNTVLNQSVKEINKIEKLKGEIEDQGKDKYTNINPRLYPLFASEKGNEISRLETLNLQKQNELRILADRLQKMKFVYNYYLVDANLKNKLDEIITNEKNMKDNLETSENLEKDNEKLKEEIKLETKQIYDYCKKQKNRGYNICKNIGVKLYYDDELNDFKMKSGY